MGSNILFNLSAEWRPIFIGGEKSHFFISGDGVIKSMYKGREKIIQQHLWDGYYKVHLRFNGGKLRARVHRLVAIYFVENIGNHPEVNHLDGDKKNNNYLNLQWVSKQDNMRHAVLSGLYKTRQFDNKSSVIINRWKDNFVDKSYPSFHQLNKSFPATSVIRAIKSGKIYRGYKLCQD